MRGRRNLAKTDNSDYQDLLAVEMERTLIALNEAKGKAIKSGAQGGSRDWINRQSVLLKGIGNYKLRLLSKLRITDVKFTSVRDEDFSLAKLSLKELRLELEEHYKSMAKAAAPFGSIPAFDIERFDRELRLSLVELSNAEREFKSSKSLLLRIWFRLLDQAIGLLAGTVLGLASKDFFLDLFSKFTSNF